MEHQAMLICLADLSFLHRLTDSATPTERMRINLLMAAQNSRHRVLRQTTMQIEQGTVNTDSIRLQALVAQQIHILSTGDT